jgi:hypothetical protein
MKWVAAGLTFVSAATVAGLLFGIAARGLGTFTATAAFSVGIVAAILACLRTSDAVSITNGVAAESPWQRYRAIWKWLVAGCFLIFAVRSFCWLLYIDGEEFRIQSPNNLGDLALHITFIKNFANGVPLWPDNPIFDGSKLRYPAGVDLFNALLSLQHVELIPALAWTGLLGSIATFCMFYRWGGTFAVAGFLFNGGLLGFKFLETHQLIDYQGVNDVAWKSIPLSMLVTQRGLLYAIPAGLLLLYHWREKFYHTEVVAAAGGRGPSDNSPDRLQQSPLQGPLPFWTELLLYASMPLFHVHTFLALSAVLVCLFVFGDNAMRRHVARLVGAAVVPASFLVWLISDHFHAGSVFAWQPGWVQAEKDSELAAPFVVFWLKNFGIWVPLVLTAIGLYLWQFALSKWRFGQRVPEHIAFIIPAIGIFLFAYFVKTAPWGWDNLKIMIWSYFLILPFVWDGFVKTWSLPVRVIALIALFGSGFVTLFGGLAAGRPGYGFGFRGEIDGVGHVVKRLPVDSRFAAYPTYNHPLLLQGRNLVLGYPGHLWTEGYDYGPMQQQLTQLMTGTTDWQAIARRLNVRYIFWGREEATNYPASTKPWEKQTPRVASGNWGVIYDVNSPANPQK